MLGAFTAVFPLLGLGLVVGFSPGLAAVTLRTLTRETRPLRRVVALCAGMVVATTLMLVVFRSVDPETIISALRLQVAEVIVRRSVDFAAAAVLLLAATVVFRTRTRPRRDRTPKERRQPRDVDLFALGFVQTVFSVSGLATLYVTGRVISGLSPSWVWRGAAYAVFVVALVGPYLLVTALWHRIPGLNTVAVSVTGWITRQDFRPVLAAALAVTAIVFVALGVGGL